MSMILRARTVLRPTLTSSYIHTSAIRLSELKASTKLIAEIRKITDNQTSFAKAKEALLATQNDLGAALTWLEKDNIVSGAKKAAKVASRIANDGLVGISVLSDGSRGKTAGGSSVRAAMVEVNCETDFVARNDLFSKLVADIAHTAAYLAETPSSSSSHEITKSGLIHSFPIDILSAAPLLSVPSSSNPAPLDPSRTVSSAIQDATAKIGEKISLRRACSFVGPALPPNSSLALRAGTYVHQSNPIHPQAGKIGTLIAIALKSKNLAQFVEGGGDNDVRIVGRALARQIIGFNAEHVKKSDGAVEYMGDESSTALYAQPFMMRPGGGTDVSVRTALDDWGREKGLVLSEDSDAENDGIEVLEFVIWSAGEGIEKAEPEGGFA